MASPTIEIAKREFLENVLSLRFVVALVLSTLILVTSFVALSAAYKEDHDAYVARQQSMESNAPGLMRTVSEVHKHVARPNPLGIFVGGPGDDLRAQHASGAGGGFSARYEPQSGGASPTNARFEPLDLGFVAAVVLTFLAVMFSYDAISGEKERGTLKLVLANPVPRDAILLGKYLGGMASVLLPFGVGLAAGLAALALMDVTMGPGAWLRLGVILAALVLLLSAFYLVGLMVSALSRRSSTSLLVVTLVWLVLVFGAGNAAAVAAKAGVPAPSSAEMFERNREIDDRIFNEWRDVQDQEQMARSANASQGDTMVHTFNARMSEIGEQAARDREELRASAMRKLDDQVRFAESVAAASPVEAFRSLSTSLARSDYWSFRDVVDAAEEYQREVERQREEWAAEHGKPASMGAVYMMGPGGAVQAIDGGENDYQPPDFAYRPAAVSEQLAKPAAIRDMLVLLGYNLGAFLAAYLAFLRYDVR